MKVNRIRQNVLPVLAALIWGTAFVAQSVSAEFIQPFTFNTLPESKYRSYCNSTPLPARIPKPLFCAKVVAANIQNTTAKISFFIRIKF
jgi:hypothetical protein